MRDGERGYVLVAVAILLFATLAFAVLAVDISVASTARAQAQRAADAAALAGAYTFIVTPLAPQPATATDHAMQTALNNRIVGDEIVAGDVTISVNTASRIVTVTIANTQEAMFAGIIGQEATIGATGIAEAAANATGTGNVKPFFIPNTALSDLDPCVACGAGELLVQNNQVTNWVTTQIQSGNNQFQVKPNDPAQALRPGDFFLIDLSGSVPGEIDEIIGGFIADPRFCAQVYSVLTGNHVGPTNHGIEDMIGCPDNRDVYIAPGQYQQPGGIVTNTSKALFVAPIWDVCTAQLLGQPFCPDAKFPGGTQVQLQVVGFALIFMEGFQTNPNDVPACNGNNAVGRLVGVFACGGSGGGGAGIDPEETGPFAIPLRLIRPPAP